MTVRILTRGRGPGNVDGKRPYVKGVHRCTGEGVEEVQRRIYSGKVTLEGTDGVNFIK